MNKKELIEKVAITTDHKFTKADIEKVFNAMGEVIKEQLKAGEEIKITGFASLKTKEMAARTGLNPHTGEKIQIPASKTVAFKAGKELKDAVK